MSVTEDINNDLWLSVIIPSYNGQFTIGDALSNVQRQNNNGVEVVVVDDGSTDSTLEIVKSYSDSLNIKIIELEHSGNWVANTNRGIVSSSGKYICFLHQDDRWENDRLKIVHSILKDNPEVAMCFHPAWFIGPDGKHIRLWGCPFRVKDGIEMVSPEILLQSLLVQNFITVSSPVFKKGNALKAGLLDESMIYTADWDFWLKMSQYGPIAYIPRPLTCFMVHPESQTERFSKNAEDVEKQLSCVLNRHFKRYVAGKKDKQRLWKIASYSVRLNVELMKWNSGRRINWIQLFWHFLVLGFGGWVRLIRYSRIIDRVLARLHVKYGYVNL